MHLRLALFLEKFCFVIKHTYAKSNCVVDTFSQRMHLLTTIQSQITGFTQLRNLYSSYHSFSKTWNICLQHKPMGEFTIRDGILFCGNQCSFQTHLCVIYSSSRTYIREAWLHSWAAISSSTNYLLVCFAQKCNLTCKNCQKLCCVSANKGIKQNT